jgi:alpha-N-acetylglucosamine transferase
MNLFSVIFIVFIVDLDSDVLPIKNLDEAFDITRGEFLAPSDRNSELKDLPTFNAGIFLIRYSFNYSRTNKTKINEFLKIAEDTTLYDTRFYEQGMLNYYYRDVTQRLPREYSGNYVQIDAGLIEKEHLRTLHEKYWSLSKDGESGKIRKIFEDAIVDELREYLQWEIGPFYWNVTTE